MSLPLLLCAQTFDGGHGRKFHAVTLPVIEAIRASSGSRD
jgi:hypothetical protein